MAFDSYLAPHGLDHVGHVLFDDEGMPRDLPPTSAHILAELLPADTVTWLETLPDHTPLSSLLSSPPKRVPIQPLTPEQLSAFNRQQAGGSAAAASSGGAGGGAAATSAAAPLTAEEQARLDPRLADIKPDPILLAQMLPGFNRTVLLPVVESLKALNWPEWRTADPSGNPFLVQITKDYAAAVGLHDYHDYISRPMSLNYMSNKANGGSGSQPYATAEAFLSDLHLIARNAKKYNCPYTDLRDKKGPNVQFPHPDTLGERARAAAPVYALAFALEAEINKVEPRVKAGWERFLLDVKARTLADLEAKMAAMRARSAGAATAGQQQRQQPMV